VKYSEFTDIHLMNTSLLHIFYHISKADVKVHSSLCIYLVERTLTQYDTEACVWRRMSCRMLTQKTVPPLADSSLLRSNLCLLSVDA
jgi:hypothetical protein